MVQTLRTTTLSPNEKIILIERPRVLRRIFFGIRALSDQTTWYQSKVSFDDPLFVSFFVLNGPAKYFESEGVDIFQGDIWVLNASAVNLQYTATEILH